MTAQVRAPLTLPTLDGLGLATQAELDAAIAVEAAARTAADDGKQPTIGAGTFPLNPTPGVDRTAVVTTTDQTVAGIKTLSAAPVLSSGAVLGGALTMAQVTSAEGKRVLTLQPIAANKAPFVVEFDNTLFAGIPDPVMSIGYNITADGGTPPLPSEPGLAWKIEADYYDGAGRKMESYYQYLGVARTVSDAATVTGSPTVTGTFNALGEEVGKSFAAPGVPVPSYIGAVNGASSIGLSSSPIANVPVNATATASGLTATIGTGSYRPFMLQIDRATDRSTYELNAQSVTIGQPMPGRGSAANIMALRVQLGQIQVGPATGGPSTLSVQASAGQKGILSLGYNGVDAVVQLLPGASSNYGQLVVNSQHFYFAAIASGVVSPALGIGGTPISPLHIKATNLGLHVVTVDQITGGLGNLIQARDSTGVIYFRVNKLGYAMTRRVSAPVDADLVASEQAWWFKDTPGAAGPQFKAKDSGGAVTTKDFSTQTALPDTTGASLPVLEVEVNALKAKLRNMGVMA